MKTLGIVGSGISGLSAAVFAQRAGHQVTLITKTSIKQSNSYLAKGGIIYCNKDGHNELLEKDIQSASSQTSLPSTVQFVSNKAKEIIDDLLIKTLDIPFDKINGKLSRTKEAVHQERRIIHHKDFTGKIIIDYLTEYIRSKPNITILENSFVINLIKKDNIVFGLHLLKDNPKEITSLFFDQIILATGGIGQCYQNTSNSSVSTGDGIALAKKAGAHISHMEYTQFHPTCLYTKQPLSQLPLISEALRGEGATIVNEKGEDFLSAEHSLGSLAPRDILSRSLFNQIQKSNSKFVYLDISKFSISYLKKRFPTIYATCLENHINLSENLIPVTPAFHFSCGGVITDLSGKTNVHNLFVIGESAYSGLHGVNRLASSSLLECLIFAKEASLSLDLHPTKKLLKSNNHLSFFLGTPLPSKELEDIWLSMKTAMWTHVGIIRNKNNLLSANLLFNQLLKKTESIMGLSINKDSLELKNALDVSITVTQGALRNPESLGCHFCENNI